jgi:hypothetical protein
MIREEDFAAAADGPPDIAFVRLERKFREILEQNLEASQSGGASNHFIIEYMNHTLATAGALDLDFLEFYAVPYDNSSDVYDSYRRFRQTVDSFTVRVQISHIRLGPAHTVPLDADEKKHLRAYVTKIKEIIDASSLVTAKKERLLDKLNAFLAELDRDRTALQKFNDVIQQIVQEPAFHVAATMRKGSAYIRCRDRDEKRERTEADEAQHEKNHHVSQRKIDRMRNICIGGLQIRHPVMIRVKLP